MNTEPGHSPCHVWDACPSPGVRRYPGVSRSSKSSDRSEVLSPVVPAAGILVRPSGLQPAFLWCRLGLLGPRTSWAAPLQAVWDIAGHLLPLSAFCPPPSHSHLRLVHLESFLSMAHCTLAAFRDPQTSRLQNSCYRSVKGQSQSGWPCNDEHISAYESLPHFARSEVKEIHFLPGARNVEQGPFQETSGGPKTFTPHPAGFLLSPCCR